MQDPTGKKSGIPGPGKALGCFVSEVRHAAKKWDFDPAWEWEYRSLLPLKRQFNQSILMAKIMA